MRQCSHTVEQFCTLDILQLFSCLFLVIFCFYSTPDLMELASSTAGMVSIRSSCNRNLASVLVPNRTNQSNNRTEIHSWIWIYKIFLKSFFLCSPDLQIRRSNINGGYMYEYLFIYVWPQEFILEAPFLHVWDFPEFFTTASTSTLEWSPIQVLTMAQVA